MLLHVEMDNFQITFLVHLTQVLSFCAGNICLRWRKDNFNLTLSCIADNLEHKVTFYDYLNTEQAFCIVSFPDPICHSYLEASDIRQNLTTNETIFVIQNVSKEYKAGRWTCSHGSNNEEAMTDIKSTAIDTIGPEIRSNQTLPYLEGTIIEMVCIASRRENIARLSWECLPSSTLHKPVIDCSVQLIKLTYTASANDSGKVCKCIADVNGYVSSTSIKIDIKGDAFKLNIIDELNCESRASVVIHCSIQGKSSLFGFLPWMHTVNGYFVREIMSETNGHTSTLSLQSCNVEDSGQYTCSVWFINQDGETRLNKSSKLAVSGRPSIIDTSVTWKPNIVLVATVLSTPDLESAHWYRITDEIQNSTEFHQRIIRSKIKTNFYKSAVIVDGFVVRMDIFDNLSVDTTVNLSVELKNTFGITTTYFNLSNNKFKDKDVFDGQLVYVTLIVITVVVIIAVVSAVVIAKTFRKNLSIPAVGAIYYAAPQNDNEVNIYRSMAVAANSTDESHHYYEISNSDIESEK